MRPADQLAAFAGDALRAGRSREEIREALTRAGWSESEITLALNAWAEVDFTPPVPRPRPFVSAREAFLYGLMFVALAVSAWHVTWLAFSLIDLWITAPADEFSASDESAIRWSVSTLIVFFPLFLYLDGKVLRAGRADPAARRSSVRRWFGYITLFLTSITLLGTLITVIYAFLEGDLTSRFVLKALTVALVAGVILLYFRSETEENGNAP